jgi:hypothetical protein
MMELLAAVRPDDWNLPLLLHVLGAMTLVGALVLATASLAATWRRGSHVLTRLGFRALLWAAIPAWIATRVGAEWVADEEMIPSDDPPSWVDVGYQVSDPGLLLLVVATILTGIGARRTARGTGSAVGLDRVATVLLAISLVTYLVAVWAMTTKPD